MYQHFDVGGKAGTCGTSLAAIMCLNFPIKYSVCEAV